MADVDKIKHWMDEGYELLTIKKATRFELAGKYYCAVLRKSPMGIKTLIYIRAVPANYQYYYNRSYADW
jgi:hypothetical protein